MTYSLYFSKEDGNKAIKMTILGWTRYLKVKPSLYLKIILKIRSKQFSSHRIEKSLLGSIV